MARIVKMIFGMILATIGVILFLSGGMLASFFWSLGNMSGQTQVTAPAYWLGSVIWIIGVVLGIGGFYLFLKAIRQPDQALTLQAKQQMKDAFGEAMRDQQYAPPPPPPQNTVACKSCGYINVTGSSFCNKCGARLD